MTLFPRSLAGFTATVFTAALAAAVLMAVRGQALPVQELLIFGALVLLTAHMPVRLSNSVLLSPGLMVCMAAIVVFGARDSVLGVMIVCSLAHVRFAHFRKGTWPWLPFNIGVSGLAYMVTAMGFMALPASWTMKMLPSIATAIPVACLYLIAVWSLLLASYVIEGDQPWREVLGGLLPVALHVLPFAVLGFFLGRLYLEFGPAVMLLVIVPILIAREMFGAYIKVRESHDETVHMLIRALEAKDRYTAGHVERVAAYSQYVGHQMHFGPARMERLRFAALMHDIGKLIVPNHLLNKPGKLTEGEFARIKTHEKVSVQMLSQVEFLRPIAGVAHSDNTRFDPDDPDHPIEPYIVMIADAYDAMTSTRSYRKALPQEVAFKELRDKAGIQFHPACVEALIAAIEARGEKHGAGYEVQAEFEDAPEVGVGSAGLGDLLPAEA